VVVEIINVRKNVDPKNKKFTNASYVKKIKTSNKKRGKQIEKLFK